MKREARNQHYQKTSFTYETAYAEGVKAHPVPFIIFYYYSYGYQITLENLSGRASPVDNTPRKKISTFPSSCQLIMSLFGDSGSQPAFSLA